MMEHVIGGIYFFMNQQALLENIAAVAADTVALINHYTIMVPEGDRFAGDPRLFTYDQEREVELLGHVARCGNDNLHYPLCTSFLNTGLGPIIEASDKAAKTAASPVKRSYASGISQVYSAISLHIRRHALLAHDLAQIPGPHQNRYREVEKTCSRVALEAPRTLEEALQLYWFVWMLRSAVAYNHRTERGFYTATLGRLDQHLYPFYRRDTESGTLTHDTALTLVMDYWRKLNEAGTGDTLKNLTLGGRDENGQDQSNALSLIFLEASIKVQQPEPHVNVRVHPNASEKFLALSYKLALQGQGQGVMYNDEIIIPSLISYGLDEKTACNYCCDGCEEVIIDGDSAIEFAEMEATKALELALFNGKENPYVVDTHARRWSRELDVLNFHSNLVFGYETGNLAKAQSFEEVYDAFLRQYLYQVKMLMKRLSDRYTAHMEEGVTSFVTSGADLRCCETGGDLLRDVHRVKVYQVHSGPIPSVADSLAAIKKVVFEDHVCTMEELLYALSKNFDGYETLRICLQSAPKFGNDDDYVDSIANEIGRKFCEVVKNTQAPFDGHFWPGLYSIFFNEHAIVTKATPDGRRWGEPISVHYSPVPGCAHEGPTALLMSASKACMKQAVAASPVFLTVSRSLLPENEEGLQLVKAIFNAALSLGLPILSLSVHDVSVLRMAQKDPERYRDIIVRVWGFSARFVELTPEMQEHVIRRTIER
jgi:pyruvate-formate lyase